MIALTARTKSRRHRNRRHHHSQTTPAHKQNFSDSSFKVLALVNEWYRVAFDYRTYRFIQKSLRYNDDVASPMQKMCNNVAVQMNNQTYDGQDLISFINLLTEIMRACDSSQIHEGTAIWLFIEFMSGPTPTAIKARLTFTSNDADWQKGTIATYPMVVNHLLMRYATNAVIANAQWELTKLWTRLANAMRFLLIVIEPSLVICCRT